MIYITLEGDSTMGCTSPFGIVCVALNIRSTEISCFGSPTVTVRCLAKRPRHSPNRNELGGRRRASLDHSDLPKAFGAGNLSRLRLHGRGPWPGFGVSRFATSVRSAPLDGRLLRVSIALSDLATAESQRFST